jgi:hypothetical protein
MWRCDCGSGHFLAITIWPSEEDSSALDLEGYLDVEGDFWTTWRNRFAMAWNIIIKGHAHSRVGLVFDPPKAREVASVLAAYAAMCDAQRASGGRRISGWECEHMNLTSGALPATTNLVAAFGCGCQLRPVYEEAAA